MEAAGEGTEGIMVVVMEGISAAVLEKPVEVEARVMVNVPTIDDN